MKLGKILEGRRGGFTLIFVLMLVSLLSTAAYHVLNRFDVEVKQAADNLDNTSAFYWQDGRLRLIRYKFSLELMRNGPGWPFDQQQTKLDEIRAEVLPEGWFNWRETLHNENGGYESQMSYRDTYEAQNL